MKPERLDLKSMDITEQKIRMIKAAFPEVFTEAGKIDFEMLKTALGETVDSSGKERYVMSWPGKSKLTSIIQETSTGTLRPVEKESVNWDSAEHVFIEGDNLEALKLLQKSYLGTIKMIYIDPPYNTGNDFIYPDDFSNNLENYLQLTGQVDIPGRKIASNSETSGRYHSNWLNMMYPRLFLSRNLLREDGVIFMSIGKRELDNLVKLVHEIFGEENVIEIVSRIAKKGSSMGSYFSPAIDYIVVCAKNIDSLHGFSEPLTDRYRAKYKMKDDKDNFVIKGLYQSSLDPLRGCANQRYYIECPDGTLAIPPGENFPAQKKDGEKIAPQNRKDKVWRWAADSYLQKKDRLYFKKSDSSPLVDETGNRSKWNVYTKQYLTESEEKGYVPGNFIADYPNSLGSKDLGELKSVFDFPKPSGLIVYFMKLCGVRSGDFVLDYFAGSCTTAHAVLDLNREDRGARRIIMAQLPEPCGENTEAFKAGYKTIADIGKERIRRVIKRLNHESSLINTNNEKDLFQNNSISEDSCRFVVKNSNPGFRVFKLDISNFKPWSGDIDNTEELKKELDGFIDPIILGRTQEDILFEILLKSGYKLSSDIKEIEIAGKRVFVVSKGALFICLEDEAPDGLFTEVAEKEPKLFICLDKAFGGRDDRKTNAVSTFALKQNSDGTPKTVFKTV